MVTHLEAPYYAVIFSTILTDNCEGYLEATKRMELLAKQQKGYLGIESARSEIGITVSYWQSLEAILAWKNNLEHTSVRSLGREMWYKKSYYKNSFKNYGYINRPIKFIENSKEKEKVIFKIKVEAVVSENIETLLYNTKFIKKESIRNYQKEDILRLKEYISKEEYALSN
jgi:heme-degrading monooxygenase HmoA